MNTDVNNPQQPGHGQQPPPGTEEKDKRGVGEGQPKPGDNQGPEIPEIPQEVPKKEIERKPADPQTQPNQGPEHGPKQEIYDKGTESEENNDVDERSFDKDLSVEDDRDSSSLVDTRDRFPFPNK